MIGFSKRHHFVFPMRTNLDVSRSVFAFDKSHKFIFAHIFIPGTIRGNVEYFRCTSSFFLRNVQRGSDAKQRPEYVRRTSHCIREFRLFSICEWSVCDVGLFSTSPGCIFNTIMASEVRAVFMFSLNCRFCKRLLRQYCHFFPSYYYRTCLLNTIKISYIYKIFQR